MYMYHIVIDLRFCASSLIIALIRTPARACGRVRAWPRGWPHDFPAPRTEPRLAFEVLLIVSPRGRRRIAALALALGLTAQG
jgi:hypothetical protein